MKNKFVLVGSLLLSNFFTKAQKVDNTIKVDQTEVELIYNHYTQSGNNSPVTGGIGTEKLSVYGPSLNLKRSFGKNSIDFQLGADIISSASTDNIDTVVSSASKLDIRTYSNINYTRLLGKNISLSGGLGFSIESDYFSFAKYFGISKISKDKMQTFSAQIQIFNDDLRWGRLNSDANYGPAFLIYPKELRYREWYDVYKRNSYNLNLDFTQIVDERNILGIYGTYSYQKGLLATPFHRIYFSDNSLAVEQLPKMRQKGLLALKWNRFVNGNLILKNNISGYTDNFGIQGFSVENETVLKINPRWTLLSNIRYYTQNASKYFAPYKMHQSNETYYTSDYDLSKFNAYKIGFGIKFSPFNYITKQKRFDSATLHYNFYKRSNNLNAHMFSLSIKHTRFFTKRPSQKQPRK